MEAINAEKSNLSQMFVFSATFFFLFQFLIQYMPKRFSWFLNLQPHLQVGTVIRIISTIHAIIATFLSILILSTDHGLSNNKLIYSSFGISFTLNLSIGFLAFDCLIMFLHRNEFELGYGVHHCVSIIAFYRCTTDGVFPYIALSRLMSEASTVFVNNRWILLTLKKKESKLYFWNGLAGFLVFGLVRILTIIPNWMIFFSLIETPEWNSVEFKNKFICVASSAPLDLLNIYWFSKIARMVLKYFYGQENKTSQVEQQEMSYKKCEDLSNILKDTIKSEITHEKSA